MVELVFNRVVSHIGLAMAATVCLFSWSQCRQPAPPAEANTTSSGEIRIDLDVIPMMTPVATVFSMRGARAEVVRYSRPRLTVTAAARGAVPEARLLRITEAVRSPGLRAAFRTRSFVGEGLSSGDQFHLSVAEPWQGECFGFVEEAPEEVRALLQDLLRLSADLDEAPLAAAYVRSEPIEPQRSRGLKTVLPFYPLHEIPLDLQTPAAEAIERPRAFIVLQPSQTDRFFKVSGGQHQLYVTTDKGEHELTFYQGRTASNPSGARREQDR